MNVTDVTIVISRLTAPLSQAGLGIPLILSTSGAFPYEEYGDMTEVVADWAAETPEYKMANALFAQVGANGKKIDKVAILGVVYTSGVTATTVLTDALNTLLLTRGDWYFLMCTGHTLVEISALSTWAESNKRLYFAVKAALTDIGTIDKDRTVIMYHNADTTYPEAAWIGACAPDTVGSITWKFKKLNGIDPSNVNVTQLNTLHADGGNTYILKMGHNQTSEGQTTSGEFIDVIMSQDWVEATLNQRISDLLYQNPKIPFDNAGISMVVATVDGVMKEATSMGIILKDDDGNGVYTVTAPTRAEISQSNLSNRILPDIKFTFKLAGAVHKVNVSGVISL